MDDNERKTEVVNFFLRFIAADLENAGPEDRRIWTNFIQGWTGFLGATLIPVDSSAGLLISPIDKDWQDVKDMQRLWSEQVGQLLLYTCVGEDEGVIAAAIIYDAPQCFTWGLSTKGVFTHRRYSHFYTRPTKARIYGEEALVYINSNYNVPDTLPYHEIDLPPGFIGFLVALSEFPRRSLKSCLRCGRFFFTPTKLRKRYCSPYCQKIDSVHRSRLKKKQAK